MTAIIGAIDNSEGLNVFNGWARYGASPLSGPIMVSAYAGEEVLGQTEVKLPRKDLNGPFGFSLRLARNVTTAELRAGQCRIVASGGELTNELLLTSRMLEIFEAREIGVSLQSRSDYEIQQMIAGLTGGANRPLLRAIRRSLEEFQLGGKADYFGTAETKPFSPFNLRVGLKSRDRSAVVGHEGYMFVLAGSNQLYQQYQTDISDPAVQNVGRQWLDLVATRKAALGARGIRFLQVIIPEKSSVIPEFFPAPITPPTPQLRSIVDAVTAVPDLRAVFLDALALMADDPMRLEIFRKVDSHMSAYGAYSLFGQMLDKLGFSMPWECDFPHLSSDTGDLGSKFTYAPMSEPLRMLDPAVSTSLSGDVTQLEKRSPSDGSHTGTRVVWQNPSAPIPLRVIAFGSSSFERGGREFQLSWWASRCFKEFHFIWRSTLDLDYVDHIQPDIVICQTIERFVASIPKT